MKITAGYNEELFKRICRSSGNPQTMRDLNYMRVIRYNQGTGRKILIYGQSIDDKACIFGYTKMGGVLRIVCIAVARQWQRHGFGQELLYRAMQFAQDNRMHIETRTRTGVRFYMKYGGAYIVGKRGDDFVLRIDV